MQRRDFLKTTALLPLTLTHQANAAEPKAMLPIIDTHQHLWDLDRLKLSWLKPDAPLGHNFVSKDFAVAVDGLNVVQAVYMEVDVIPEDTQKEADDLINIIQSKKTVTRAAVLGGRPASEKFKEYAAQFKGSAYVKGIRQVIHSELTPEGYSLEKPFIAGVRYLGEIGLSFDICIRPKELSDAAKLVDACPDTRFILDHCGNGNVQAKPEERNAWKKAMADLARRKNLVCKVSGIVATAEKGKWSADDLAPLVRHTIEVFGWDRVMFGGDWPVCTLAGSYKDWVIALKSIIASDAEANQRKLLHDNAKGFYGLKDA